VRKLAPEAFIGIKALSAGVAFAVAGFLATFGFPAVLVPVVAGIAWLVPDAWLSGRLEKRQKQIRGDLPMLVSLIVTALRAGIELGPALEEVGCNIAGPLGEEIRIAWREMATGRSRGSALRAAADRCGVQEFTRFVETIVTAEERGTPDLAGVLSDYMTDLRETARRHADKEARKAPVKMNLPLIGCIFIPMVVMLLSLVFFSIAGGGF
jgi:tight adherence protein C